MAVRFPDKALDEWINTRVKEMENSSLEAIFILGYLQALEDTQNQLHAFWCKDMG
jgi:hypothetical protein